MVEDLSKDDFFKEIFKQGVFLGKWTVYLPCYQGFSKRRPAELKSKNFIKTGLMDDKLYVGKFFTLIFAILKLKKIVSEVWARRGL